MKINNLLSTSTDGGLNWDILLEQYLLIYTRDLPRLQVIYKDYPVILR